MFRMLAFSSRLSSILGGSACRLRVFLPEYQRGLHIPDRIHHSQVASPAGHQRVRLMGHFFIEAGMALGAVPHLLVIMTEPGCFRMADGAGDRVSPSLVLAPRMGHGCQRRPCRTDLASTLCATVRMGPAGGASPLQSWPGRSRGS